MLYYELLQIGKTSIVETHNQTVIIFIINTLKFTILRNVEYFYKDW